MPSTATEAVRISPVTPRTALCNHKDKDSFATVWRFPETPTAGSTRKVGPTSYFLSQELLRDALSCLGAPMFVVQPN